MPTTTPQLDRDDARRTGTPDGRAHDNRVRGPFNSWFLDLVNGHVESALGGLRDEVAATVAGARELVEIGPGNGPLLARLDRGTIVHAIEPNRHFHDRLRDAATDARVELRLHPSSAASIPLPDDSVDAVVGTWVLCTVAEPAAVVREIRRVLRPGGRYAFYEHVGAPTGSAVRRVQRVVRRPWGWCFEGCDPTRDTAATIAAAGFARVEHRQVTVPTPFVPVRPTTVGVAEE